jgi:hypothetical protein
LGFELRASHLLGRCCSTWATPLAKRHIWKGNLVSAWQKPWISGLWGLAFPVSLVREAFGSFYLRGKNEVMHPFCALGRRNC